MGWTAKLVPQMWVNGQAVEVAATAQTTWPISEYDVDEAIDEARRGSDWDYLREDANAPSWVREWPGPFYIELIGPDRTVICHRPNR